MKIRSLTLLLSSCLFAGLPQRSEAIDLLKHYPTSLTAGDLLTAHAREWRFTDGDVFSLSRFELGGDNNKGFSIEIGPADLGVGRVHDGAVWALVIPRESGTLTLQATNHQAIDYIWLRFHPSRTSTACSAETVSAEDDTNLASQMRSIADTNIVKGHNGAGDTNSRPETNHPGCVEQKTDGDWHIRYHPKQIEKPPIVFTPELAAEAFDLLWETFDQHYAMFGLRPEVDSEQVPANSSAHGRWPANPCSSARRFARRC